MTGPDPPAVRPGSRVGERVASGDFISWETWCGRTTAYVVCGNDARYYKHDLSVSLRAADHHDEFHPCVPGRAEWATEEEVTSFIERSRSRWADGQPAVPESALQRWRSKLAPASRAEDNVAPESPLGRLDGLPSGNPPGLGI